MSRPTYRERRTGKKTCPFCGVTFSYKRTRASSRRKFCSLECYRKNENRKQRHKYAAAPEYWRHVGRIHNATFYYKKWDTAKLKKHASSLADRLDTCLKILEARGVKIVDEEAK